MTHDVRDDWSEHAPAPIRPALLSARTESTNSPSGTVAKTSTRRNTEGHHGPRNPQQESTHHRCRLRHRLAHRPAAGLFHEIDDDGWTSTLETDLLGPIRLVREFLPDLRRGRWGRLVLTASEDALQPYDDELPYCAAKAGIMSFAKGLSRSYATEGLLVNTVGPAFIHTPMTDKMMTGRATQRGTSFGEAIDSFLEEERPHLELKRRGEPEEVASVIAFLVSDRASFVNGSNYRVDAGSVATI